MASVSFRNVYKRYAGDVTAVKNLNIEVNDKEFLVLVGPSGCGKTTSLRMLAGLEEISDGEILIGDRVVNNVAPKDRDIAMVFQSYALYPHMSVYDNMAFGLRLRKTPKQVIDERVREVAKNLGIEALLDREPLSNLDAKLRVESRAFISKLHQRLGTTFIYVTHDQVEAMTMGTRIAVMSAGELQQLDTPQSLYDHPSNVFVAGFVGSPSMNFFDATLVDADGKFIVETASFRVAVPPNRYDLYRPVLGKKVIFGIRPEDIHDPQFLPTNISNTSHFEANIDVVEQMGNEKIVYLEEGGKTFVSRMDPRTMSSIGHRMDVAFNMDNMHLFDAQTEKTLDY